MHAKAVKNNVHLHAVVQ